MALSTTVVEQHIARWSDALKKGSHPYREHWPTRLFRHEPVENAATILRSGRLLSREDSATLRVLDIADKEVIASRGFAHRYARLYFRPRNPTQYHIEGIKKPGEFYRNDPQTHAPVLVILIFKAAALLCAGDLMFSDGNMQSSNTSVFSTDDEFLKLPFESIYHTGVYDKNTQGDILRMRCAEVLAPSPLILDDRLQAVLCRSPAERATLVHLLGDQASKWSPRIRVFSEPGIFESRWTFVDAVAVSTAGVEFTLHPRFDRQLVRVDIEITSLRSDQTKAFSWENGNPAFKFNINMKLGSGAYLVKIRVDNCAAYEGVSLVDELPF